MDVSPSPVPWSRLAAFIRQLGHDIRNDLNALSLEAALLKELVNDPEAVTSANRIQTQLREIANRLKDLSGRYVIPAAQMDTVTIEELGSQLQAAVNSDSLALEIVPGPGMVKTDPALLGRAFRELAQNAIQHSPLHQKPQASLSPGLDGGAVLTMREFGGEDYDWPDTPFTTPRAGRYGVGLPLAAAIFRGLGAKVDRKRDGDALETRIILPAA